MISIPNDGQIEVDTLESLNFLKGEIDRCKKSVIELHTENSELNSLWEKAAISRCKSYKTELTPTKALAKTLHSFYDVANKENNPRYSYSVARPTATHKGAINPMEEIEMAKLKVFNKSLKSENQNYIWNISEKQLQIDMLQRELEIQKGMNLQMRDKILLGGGEKFKTDMRSSYYRLADEKLKNYSTGPTMPDLKHARQTEEIRSLIEKLSVNPGANYASQSGLPNLINYPRTFTSETNYFNEILECCKTGLKSEGPMSDLYRQLATTILDYQENLPKTSMVSSLIRSPVTGVDGKQFYKNDSMMNLSGPNYFENEHPGSYNNFVIKPS